MTKSETGTGLLLRLLVPGLVFQAVIMGAGYTTGRELVEFFMQGSIVTGLLGMAAAAAVFSICLAISLELARTLESDDYRNFLKLLVGRFWVVYEVCFAALLLVILSVLASAAGEIVANRAGWSPLIGIVGMMTAVCALVFFGTSVVERFLAGWAILLQVLFVAVLILTLIWHGDAIAVNLAASRVDGGWFQQGVAYAGYNVAIIPGILYCARRLKSRSEALTAGLLAGPIAIIPAIVFFLSMAAFWPEIVATPVPIELVLEKLDQPWLDVTFTIALFGIFVKTGAALVHAVNERIASNIEEAGGAMPGWLRPVSAILIIVVASWLANEFGIVALISSGYLWLTIAFLVIFVAPLIVVGGWRILTSRR